MPSKLKEGEEMTSPFSKMVKKKRNDSNFLRKLRLYKIAISSYFVK